MGREALGLLPSRSGLLQNSVFGKISFDEKGSNAFLFLSEKKSLKPPI